MARNTLDNFVRRIADLIDRRSLFGRLSAALLSVGLAPLSTEAKKKRKRKGKRRTKGCKKRVKDCREETLPACDQSDAPANCEDVINKCCKKACDSVEKAIRCLDEIFAG